MVDTVYCVSVIETPNTKIKNFRLYWQIHFSKDLNRTHIITQKPGLTMLATQSLILYCVDGMQDLH